MKDNDVHFYDVAAFGVSAFQWNLDENDFYPSDDDADGWLDFEEFDADEDDTDDFFLY